MSQGVRRGSVKTIGLRCVATALFLGAFAEPLDGLDAFGCSHMMSDEWRVTSGEWRV
jgi:hypothetical protein